ncbi:hypothetical protein F5887DRAFT_918117 [Amanita rubescens]|nr:hypothetical protein F5887DRAFT_918117 [Amanita rubescens]
MPKVKVLIDRDALETLVGRDFNLCLTRDVKAGPKILKGNVIFAMVPNKSLGLEVKLEWEEKYQVFETMSYQEGTKVTSGTEFADIKLGQKATFDDHGDGRVIGDVDQNKPLGVQNDWREDARVGVRSFNPITDTYHSLFLSSKILTDMTSELTPIKKFSIFWHQYLVTDTIIDNAVSDPFVFEMNRDEITIKYAKEQPHWSFV